MDVHYVFAHCLDPTHPAKNASSIRNVTGNRQWKYVRHELEQKFGMDTTRGTNKTSAACNSFLTGYAYEDWKRLKTMKKSQQLKELDDDVMLRPGELIVLVRKPMPLGFEFYNPNDRTSLGPAAETNTSWVERYDSETEAVAAFLQAEQDAETQTKNKYAPQMFSLHASAYGTSRMPRPPRTYICGNCYAIGDHFRQFCQQPHQLRVEEAKQLVHRPMPTGIPMSIFREISNEERQKLMQQKAESTMTSTGEESLVHVVYCDQKGKYYVAKGR